MIKNKKQHNTRCQVKLNQAQKTDRKVHFSYSFELYMTNTKYSAKPMGLKSVWTSRIHPPSEFTDADMGHSLRAVCVR